MTARIIEAPQGSPEWHQHRASHYNASDAAAMLGISPYKSRNELLHEKHTGIAPDVDAQTQRRFAKGHEYEAQARPWAEEIIGEELYNVTLADEIDGLPLSASLDGLTMDDGTAWEHKALSGATHEALDADVLPDHYAVQMEQQMLLSGATRCLFMASAGDKDSMRWCWYESDPPLRQGVIDGWKQFHADLQAYQPPEREKTVTGAAPEHLPALHIEVEGKVLATNLDAYKEHAQAVLANINEDLQTDEEFANAEETVKWCKGVEDKLAAAKEHALSQAGDIHDLLATVDDISEQTRQKRLSLDKLVKAEKQARKESIVRQGKVDLAAHLVNIDHTLGAKIAMPEVPADFAGAARNKRTLASLQDAVDTELANAKIEANRIADGIRANLEILREDAKGHETLFADAQALVTSKDPDDLRNLIRARIAEAKEQEERRQREREEAEERKRQQAEAEQRKPEAPSVPETAAGRPEPKEAPAAKSDATPPRPSDADIIAVVAAGFGVSSDVARAWLYELAQAA